MTIKYPVRVVKEDFAIEIGQDDWGPGFVVRDANNLACSEMELEENAHAVANALNAMNTIPDFQEISDSADEGDKNEAMVDALNIWLRSLV